MKMPVMDKFSSLNLGILRRFLSRASLKIFHTLVRKRELAIASSEQEKKNFSHPEEAQTRPNRKDSVGFQELKKRKLARIRKILRTDLPFRETPMYFDFLSDSLRSQYNIVDTEKISAHGYDPIARSIIDKNKDGLLLDCGAGKRSEYLENVVNFEIVPYDTTDVLGVGEELPFQDNSFDAVFSLNVLEHVKDPFKCASEIARVMKPGAELYCVASFLQPLHAYPHHYYNMSSHGLRNLFEKLLKIEKQEVIASGLPIWTLSWFLNSWVNGLDEKTQKEFLNMTVADLIRDPMEYLEKDFVKNLPSEKNFELASTTALFAVKPSNEEES